MAELSCMELEAGTASSMTRVICPGLQRWPVSQLLSPAQHPSLFVMANSQWRETVYILGAHRLFWQGTQNKSMKLVVFTQFCQLKCSLGLTKVASPGKHLTRGAEKVLGPPVTLWLLLEGPSRVWICTCNLKFFLAMGMYFWLQLKRRALQNQEACFNQIWEDVSVWQFLFLNLWVRNFLF